MRFDIITIFPEIFDSYLKETILKRAQEKGLITVKTHTPRRFAGDKHKSVDDRPFGGGPGMILMWPPIYKTLSHIKHKKKSKVIMLTPAGKQFTQKDANRYAKLEQLILLAGRYEGFDARIDKLVDEKISVGPYVLSGGELPAMTVVEATARLIPGVLGHKHSADDETYSRALDYIEYPQYTRPEIVIYKGKKLKVPKVLLSGNHQEIKKWRQERAKKREDK